MKKDDVLNVKLESQLKMPILKQSPSLKEDSVIEKQKQNLILYLTDA